MNRGIGSAAVGSGARAFRPGCQTETALGTYCICYASVGNAEAGARERAQF